MFLRCPTTLTFTSFIIHLRRVEILRKASQLLRKTTQEGGNTTELDAVLRSHIVKHWKNGKFYVATASITTENPTQSFVDYVDIYITTELRGSNKFP